MSLLTPEERLVLQAAKDRIERRARESIELATHERERATGRRPDVDLQSFRRGVAAAAEATARARLHLGLAFRPELEHHERLEAARIAVEALPYQLAEYSAAGPKRFKKHAQQSLTDVARAVRECLAARVVGPQCARGTSASYVQQEDLEDLVPDGWGKRFPLEVSRLGRRAGIPPLAVPLLNLLTWCSSLKPPEEGSRRQLGAGFQVSIEWFARKLGCSTTWVKELFNRLDPSASYRREVAQRKLQNAKRERQGKDPLPMPAKPVGTCYVQRFRQLKRYRDLPKLNAAAPRDAWMDRGGRVRQWVDVRGVAYVTEAGRRLLLRRKTLRLQPGQRPEVRENGTLNDLCRRLLGLRWRIEARLRRGAEGVHKAVDNSDWKSTAPPSGAPAL